MFQDFLSNKISILVQKYTQQAYFRVYNNKKIKMNTPMPFIDELARAAGSRLVKDMMVVKFKREVDVILIEEAEMTKKAKEIRSRVTGRELVIKELEMLFGFDSTIQSLAHLDRLQTEDLTEISLLLTKIIKKQRMAADLLSLIENLQAMEL